MDNYYMGIALDLAKMGIGKVNPNPLVGAVIVKSGRIIGSGYHQKYGHAHAEVNAFNNSTDDVKGATMYVTLEPCSHYGKTPPCIDKIIENKIVRVVIGMVDPNPLVAGQGVKKLREAGIEVIVGVLESQCKRLNEVFIKYITKKRPFVVLKSAMSLDGKIATVSGESKWISCDEARKQVHEFRNQLSAIMVGINTVLLDNPQLTCRLKKGRNPIRVLVDSNLRIPMESNILKNTDEIKTIIATTKRADKEKIKLLKAKGIVIIETNQIDDRVDLQHLMEELGQLGIDSVLLEGGSTLNYSALKSNIVDKVMIYVAPKVIGGSKSKGPVGGEGIKELKHVFKLSNLEATTVGEDILLQGYIRGEK